MSRFTTNLTYYSVLSAVCRWCVASRQYFFRAYLLHNNDRHLHFCRDVRWNIYLSSYFWKAALPYRRYSSPVYFRVIPFRFLYANCHFPVHQFCIITKESKAIIFYAQSSFRRVINIKVKAQCWCALAFWFDDRCM